ncbi:MarR family winged helix-turn-helix transcriptional regulator [Lactiplantibacillus fabifermentans]|uniref:HTH marR-type domain-containing protein n=2 Tax=Lactiplantibacillus fabifermentans TaxID=483011 RepID=A0A0R2NQQ9_9LACO|nr:MarR family transcriptional regulator [Lactiplantibacillus fabifermentans]ETY72667.1 hypothetical protein LFAB_16475 [Lactiplantibacillus fabifermentans T30PCM01]KRO28031.1 hypothetical protein DY78_GL002708 [Lactiplantibacillus fabifermentans DSM 21115]
MTNDDVKLGFLIKQANLKFEAARNAFYEQYGMTGSQADVLEFLKNQPAQTAPIGDIVGALQVSYATTSGLINRLEKKELVERIVNPDDQRSFLITLSDKTTVAEIFAAENAALSVVDQQLTRDFTPAEFVTFVRLLRQLNHN